MILYRITSKAHSRDLLGTGAMLYGGRWNPKGLGMLYTSESLSLATLETVVNLSSGKLNLGLMCVEINFPSSLPISIINDRSLPTNWNSYPYIPETVKIGAGFLQANELCLKVPSAIIPTEYNYLLNPKHQNFNEIKIGDIRPIILDNRLTGSH